MEKKSLITDNQVAALVAHEEDRQREGMELIASENYQSASVLAAQATVFANKYSEGTPWRRYYGGQENTDQLEQLAIDRAKALFRADHANVQPLSGAAANVCAYAAWLEPGDTVLGMDLTHGGHLTHGAPVTFMSKIFNFVRYGMGNIATGEIDYDALHRTARETKPKIILAGFSAYPRELDYAKFAQIAAEVGAVAMADMAHIAGFIAAGLLKNPLDAGFQMMTTTTHKSLRWPRGAMILTKWTVGNPLKAPEKTIENLPTLVDRAVFPGVQWGPHMQSIAAIAVALGEANSQQFKDYAKQTLLNAQILASELMRAWWKLVTWGTDNHLIVMDFTWTGLDGKQAELLLDAVGISTSKSTIPNDPNPPFKPSGLRIGLPAMTTRGFKETETKWLAGIIDRVLRVGTHDNAPLLRIKQEVIDMAKQYPVPGL
jgi:glycine hydroxymethyltransferase